MRSRILRAVCAPSAVSRKGTLSAFEAAALGRCPGVLVLALFLSRGIGTFRVKTVAHGVAAAQLQIVQNDTNNTARSVTITSVIAINDFRVRDAYNRGDVNVQIGAGFSDDMDAAVPSG